MKPAHEPVRAPAPTTAPLDLEQESLTVAGWMEEYATEQFIQDLDRILAENATQGTAIVITGYLTMWTHGLRCSETATTEERASRQQCVTRQEKQSHETMAACKIEKTGTAGS